MLVVFFPRRGLSLFSSSRPVLRGLRSNLFCLSSFVMFYSLRLVPVATATAIGFTAPLMVTAIAPLVLRERVGARDWIAVAFGFAGALIIVRPATGLHPGRGSRRRKCDGSNVNTDPFSQTGVARSTRNLEYLYGQYRISRGELGSSV